MNFIKNILTKLFNKKQTIINIQAIDTRSFCQLLEQNKDGIVNIVNRHIVRDQIIAYVPLRSGRKIPVTGGTL